MQLVDNIGTIARSGTRQFLEEAKKSGGPELEAAIGRFGCGFYSTFMVADRVEVFTKTALDENTSALHWVTDGYIMRVKGENKVSTKLQAELLLNMRDARVH